MLLSATFIFVVGNCVTYALYNEKLVPDFGRGFTVPVPGTYVTDTGITAASGASPQRRSTLQGLIFERVS